MGVLAVVQVLLLSPVTLLLILDLLTPGHTAHHWGLESPIDFFVPSLWQALWHCGNKEQVSIVRTASDVTRQGSTWTEAWGPSQDVMVHHTTFSNRIGPPSCGVTTETADAFPDTITPVMAYCNSVVPDLWGSNLH
jgi:hypothetical protein